MADNSNASNRIQLTRVVDVTVGCDTALGLRSLTLAPASFYVGLLPKNIFFILGLYNKYWACILRPCYTKHHKCIVISKPSAILHTGKPGHTETAAQKSPSTGMC